MYTAELASSLRSRMVSHYLICAFNIYLSVITFLQEDISKECKFSPEVTKNDMDKKQQGNINLRMKSWVMQSDTVTHCSHVSFVLAK